MDIPLTLAQNMDTATFISLHIFEWIIISLLIIMFVASIIMSQKIKKEAFDRGFLRGGYSAEREYESKLKRLGISPEQSDSLSESIKAESGIPTVVEAIIKPSERTINLSKKVDDKKKSNPIAKPDTSPKSVVSVNTGIATVSVDAGNPDMVLVEEEEYGIMELEVEIEDDVDRSKSIPKKPPKNIREG